jgi:hypothetical protein
MDITAADRFAIQDLYAKWCRTVDTCDAEGWADLFTDDGKRIYGDNSGQPGRAGRTFTGRRELLELRAPRAMTGRHWHGPPVLTDKGDYLESVVYSIIVDVSQDPPTIIAHFTFTDELVKLPDGSWRMRSCTSHVDAYRTLPVASSPVASG